MKPVVIWHCRTCCALTPEYPTAAGYEVDRQSDFHSAYWKAETDSSLLQGREAMRTLLDFYARHMPDRSAPHVIYDLGCGRANLLACLIAEGYRAFGCEPSPQLVDRARAVYGLDETTLIESTAEQFLATRPDNHGQVDVIFLWHVIEHLAEPLKTLREAAKHLKSGGVIICQGPLLDPEYVYPEHLFLHSESNIAWLAEAIDLKLLMIECQNPQRFASFVLGSLSHPNPAVPSLTIRDRLGAAGSLYFTYSAALRRLKERFGTLTEQSD